MLQSKYFPSAWSTANNNENARESTFTDVQDRRTSTYKDNPYLAPGSIIDEQKETRTVVNEIQKKEEGMQEGASNFSNQQSSTKSKPKKKKKKKSSKGTPGSAETINKAVEETKVGKEGTSFLEGMILLTTSLTSSVYTLV